MRPVNLRNAMLTALLVSGLAGGCTEPEEQVQSEAQEPPVSPELHSNRRAYFGDLHVHTLNSFDAFMFGARATLDDAYRFAKGDPLPHPAGYDMKLNEPLDFLAVTDHAEYLGMAAAMSDAASSVGLHPSSVAMRDAKSVWQLIDFFVAMLPRQFGWSDQDDLLDPEVVHAAWQATVEAAERHYAPGQFTTLVGYEYTASAGMAENLHRNVIFRGTNVPDQPFGAADSADPEDLWAWMEDLRANGMEALAIPHNSNASNGAMFADRKLSGEPFDAAYAGLRMRNEPIVEVTQVKGTSDTHPALSPNDEWADFEIVAQRIDFSTPSQPSGGYVREAYRNGLAMELERGFNPYRFGLIGSSDTHSGGGAFREDDYWGKTPLMDGTDQFRGSVPPIEPLGTSEMSVPFPAHYWGASGLAGVWAEANTREAIYDALRRKETFATSGPRIRLRFFAGLDLQASLPDAADRIAEAYARAVPMGGELLISGDSAPGFFVWALRDPTTVPLERLQIIKGWAENGRTFEQVFDIACADGASVNSQTHRCPENGATVDPATCATSPGRGAAELSAMWTDPDFRHGQPAFYYARVLENPTCRWSTWDAIRAGMPPREDVPATIQDRAWSSPIWVKS